MIAEIKGKISKEYTNLSERSEDNFTGNFFGVLRYLPVEIGLKKILSKLRIREGDINKLINGDFKLENPEYLFWKKVSDFGEIDLIIETRDLIVGIEVKYLSGLSSDDDSSDHNESYNQLNRYSKMLRHLYQDKDILLVFLAPVSQGIPIYENSISRNLCKDTMFAFLSWENIYKTIIEEMDYISDYFHKLILEDLMKYLSHKGFDTFSGFILFNNIYPDGYYQFNRKINSLWSNTIKIKKGNYYLYE